MPAPQFTKKDAQDVILLVQSAPLQNMRHAAAVSELLQRFSTWYEASTAEPAQSSDSETPA